MVGALTVLIALVTVYLSYNAGNSLPFVPTYDVAVQVPDAQELNDNNEVMVAGRRVGVIYSIEPRMTEQGQGRGRRSRAATVRTIRRHRRHSRPR